MTATHWQFDCTLRDVLLSLFVLLLLVLAFAYVDTPWIPIETPGTWAVPGGHGEAVYGDSSGEGSGDAPADVFMLSSQGEAQNTTQDGIISVEIIHEKAKADREKRDMTEYILYGVAGTLIVEFVVLSIVAYVFYRKSKRGNNLE